MIEGANFLGNTRSKENSNFLQAFNPATGEALPDKFFIATTSEIQRAMEMATEAFEAYKALSAERRADFLCRIGEEIMALGDKLIQQAVTESGLPEQRLIGERGRTVNQLKMYADLLREGSWVDARIDRADPERQPAPKPDLRNMLCPIGPVVAFGARNFALAYSTAAVESASALAARCPATVTAHGAPPGTTAVGSRHTRDDAGETGT